MPVINIKHDTRLRWELNCSSVHAIGDIVLKDSLLIVHYSVFEIILSKKQISIVDTPFCPKTSILGLIVNRDGSSCHFFVVFLSLAFCVGGCPEPCPPSNISSMCWLFGWSFYPRFGESENCERKGSHCLNKSVQQYSIVCLFFSWYCK